MTARIISGMLVVAVSGCSKEEPQQRPVFPPMNMPVAAPTTPVTTPATSPVPEQLPPVPPGSYTNHIGNPAHGSWGPDGQWVWKNPQSEEANDTWKYWAAAGAGAAGGAALSMLMSKKHFETRNPDGQWRPENNVNDVQGYRDRKGVPISREEYERRKAQSDRDKARHRQRLEAQRSQGYQQPKAPPQAQPRPQPKYKRWKRKRSR